MLWWIGSGLIVVWLILLLAQQHGWIQLLLVGGCTILVIQLTAYRKTKATVKSRKSDGFTPK